ncbi:MAG TPA: PadR family transcriptional regulator, partial [Desulfobacterales bacterium]|nr:PadR family transcriptional regulator [Desulfobacterales bacterium]
MIKGFFKIIILKKLNERDRSGYDLIKEIESLFEKKPSAGSIYPMLKD